MKKSTRSPKKIPKKSAKKYFAAEPPPEGAEKEFAPNSSKKGRGVTNKMKKLTLKLDTKIADRIEAISNKLEISADSFVLHAIYEKLEEVTDFQAPAMLIDLKAWRSQIESSEHAYWSIRDLFRKFYLEVTELNMERRSGKLSPEDFDIGLRASRNKIKDLFDQA